VGGVAFCRRGAHTAVGLLSSGALPLPVWGWVPLQHVIAIRRGARRPPAQRLANAAEQSWTSSQGQRSVLRWPPCGFGPSVPGPRVPSSHAAGYKLPTLESRSRHPCPHRAVTRYARVRAPLVPRADLRVSSRLVALRGYHRLVPARPSMASWCRSLSLDSGRWASITHPSGPPSRAGSRCWPGAGAPPSMSRSASAVV